jgi:hypothetical protein
VLHVSQRLASTLAFIPHPMTKTLRELLVELEQLDREIERIDLKTIASREQADARGEGTSVCAQLPRPGSRARDPVRCRAAVGQRQSSRIR